jgi:hypothetical protein
MVLAADAALMMEIIYVSSRPILDHSRRVGR